MSLLLRRSFLTRESFTGANVYYHLEKYDEAIKDCERALCVDPTFTKVSRLRVKACVVFIDNPII